MSPIESIAKRLGAAPPILALIGGRWHKAHAPPTTPMPYCVWIETDTEDFRTLTGPTPIANSTLQIDIYDRVGGIADDIAQQIRLLTHGRTATVDGVIVGEITLTGLTKNVIAPADGGEVGDYNVTIDLEVWFEQATIAAAKF